MARHNCIIMFLLAITLWTAPAMALADIIQLYAAGSLRAANWLFGAAPKDGGTIGLFGSDIPMIALLGTNPGVQLDARKFTWLGSSASFGDDAYVLVVRADAKSPTINVPSASFKTGRTTWKPDVFVTHRILAAPVRSSMLPFGWKVTANGASTSPDHTLLGSPLAVSSFSAAPY